VFFKDTDEYGLFLGGGIEQLGVQTMGVVIVFVFSCVNAFIVFLPFKLSGKIRMSAETEKNLVREKIATDSWARVEVMDNGKLDQFQFRIG